MTTDFAATPGARRAGFKRTGYVAVVAFVSLLIATTTGCSPMEDQPPSSAYDQAEVYQPMEQAVAEIVQVLPDFPGFEQRSWSETACTHEGTDDSGYTNVEIRYSFSPEASATAKVKEEYLEDLRNYWNELGLDIHRDEAVGAGFHSIEARRDDGINFYYRVASTTALMVQSGCIPRSEVSELTYIPPSGGIVPGSDQDTVAHSNRYFPDGVPEDQLTTPAIDPFASGYASPSND